MTAIRSVEFLSPPSGRDPASNCAEIQVALDGGGSSSFTAATPDQPAGWMSDAKKDFSFGTPVLFVARLDEESLGGAVEAMSREMGGYWLRYYNSAADKSRVARTLRGAAAPRAKAPAPAKALRVASAVLTEAYPPRKPDQGCAVVQARLGDGREFSLLTATPSWFSKAFRDLGLPCYFGPSILFARTLEPRVARKAAAAMASEGDRWLCLYDTPRTTLPEVLAGFKDRLFP